MKKIPVGKRKTCKSLLGGRRARVPSRGNLTPDHLCGRSGPVEPHCVEKRRKSLKRGGGWGFKGDLLSLSLFLYAALTYNQSRYADLKKSIS